MTRVCLYTRISTDEENQPTSLATQRERLEAFCAAQEEWRIIAHEEDRATGAKLDRPGLRAALELARAGKVDLLLVYRVDRLSRKVRQLAQLAEELDAVGCVLRSATEPFDTGSPAGRMMLQMLAVFAEFEHATIVDRITAGIERRAREGYWYGGRPPFGYALSPERQLVPDPLKAQVVRRIFSLYVRERLGTRAIANKLTRERAPAPAAGWSHPAVHWILTNPTYLGQIRWREQAFPGRHEPIVERDLYERAQRILKERGEDISRRRGNPSDFLLSGVVRCGRCGRAYVGMSAKGNGGLYHYYACTGRQKYGPSVCGGERLRRDHLEQAVIAQLVSLYRNGELVRAAVTKASEEAKRRRPKLDEQLAAVRTELAKLERARVRYFDAFEAGTLSPERCEERVAALETRLADLRAQESDLAVDHAQEPSEGATEADLAAVADRLEEVLTEGQSQKTKALLRLLIKELKVNGKSEILPTYRVVTPAVCATSGSVEGVGNELFGFQQVDHIEAWVPLFLFSVLFGLSMDYQVFLLSRIRERFSQTGDNRDAISFGVGSTARLITGAALIIIAVFWGFAMGDLVMFQQMGFGVAVALLLDATLIRSVVVPATMALLGRWNWYLPSWLRWLPDVHVEGAEPRREPATAAR